MSADISVKRTTESTKRSTEAGEPVIELSKKSTSKIKWGLFKVSGQRNVGKYCYIPSSLLTKSDFNFDDVFGALKIPTPQLVFHINGAGDVKTWNLKLPVYRSNLVGAKHQTLMSAQLEHYQGVVRENCKRLLKGTATACKQAGAIFKLDGLFDDQDAGAQIGRWLAEGSSVPRLSMAGEEELAEDIMSELLSNSKAHVVQSKEDAKEEKPPNLVRIDFAPWKKGTRKPERDENDNVRATCIRPSVSHLIISDDIQLLKMKLDKAIPTGLILVNGGVGTCKMFCDAILNSQPIFIFKYTGDCADLACEMLTKVESFLAKRKTNPKIRPEQPFKSNLPSVYSHPRWLDYFEKKERDICKKLNILIENFPVDRFIPTSVLQIDMFNTTEERLQDQLTKTMSVVFEGVVEMGGASGETRRLTYAWRLRHLCKYNAARQKLMADVLEFFILIFTLASTLVSVMYTFVTSSSCSDPNDPSTCAPNRATTTSQQIDILLKLNLGLPLIATIFRGLFATINPLAKFAVLQVGSIKCESEIYMYRTKVGPYNPRKPAPGGQSSQDKDKDKDKKNQQSQQGEEKEVVVNPRKVFSQALDEIWVDINASDVQKSSLMSPPDSSDPLDDVNDLIKRTRKARGIFINPLKSRVVKKTKSSWQYICEFFGPKEQNTIQSSPSQLTAANLMKSKHVKIHPSQEDKDKKGEGAGAADDKGEEDEDENQEKASVAGHSQAGDLEANKAAQGGQNDQKDVVAIVEEPLFEDGLSTLTADEYVKKRLLPMTAFYSMQTPSLAFVSTTVTFITTILSVASSVFSTFNLTAFIPLILAVSSNITILLTLFYPHVLDLLSTITAWTAYHQTDLRIVSTNNALDQLHQLVIWWDSLSMIEKRVPSNKEFLVMMTETIIQVQLVGFLSQKSKESSGDGDDA